MIKKLKFASRACVTATVRYGHAHLSRRELAPGDDTVYYSLCAITVQTTRSCVTLRPSGVIEQFVARPNGKVVIQDSDGFGLLATYDTSCPVFHDIMGDDSIFEPPFSFTFSDAEVTVAFELTEDGDKITYINAQTGSNRVVLVVKLCSCAALFETEGASWCDSEEFKGWMCKSELIDTEVQGQHVSEDFHFQPI
jgi:hypothetical protein